MAVSSPSVSGEYCFGTLCTPLSLIMKYMFCKAVLCLLQETFFGGGNHCEMNMLIRKHGKQAASLIKSAASSCERKTKFISKTP